MKLLELPIKVYKSTKEENERLESLGITVELETDDVMLYVAPNHICAYYIDPSEDNRILLYVTGQLDPFVIHMDVKEFIKVIK